MDPETRRTMVGDAALVAILRLLVESDGGTFACLLSGGDYAWIDRQRMDEIEVRASDWARRIEETEPSPAFDEESRQMRASLDRLWSVVEEAGLDALRREAIRRSRRPDGPGDPGILPDDEG